MESALKKTLKEVWRLVYPVLIYFVAAFVVQYGSMLVLTRLAIKSGDIIVSSDITAMNEQLAQLINKYSLLITALTNLVLMPVFAILLRRDDRNRIQLQGFSYTGLDIKNVCLIAVLGMSAAVSVNAIVSLSGLAYFSPKYQQVSQIIYSGGIFMEIVSAVIAAPLLEELLFRGMIYKRLRDLCSAKTAILVSAAFFGIFHGNLVQFVYAFVIGIMLAFVYEKMKTIWAPVIFHIGANLISVLITELMPEGFINGFVMLAAMAICLVITVFLLKYIYNYNAGTRPEKKSEVVEEYE